MHLSERHFKRRFKQATGESPLNYLQQVRVEAAKLALEAGAQTVESIALKCGYEDLAFFRKLFKRRTGLSPLQYRKRFSATERPQEWYRASDGS